MLVFIFLIKKLNLFLCL